MVSFSCDHCQDVLTKPKVERHLSSCRGRTVSCIDCGVTFDIRTVKPHTSCVTEEMKHGPNKPLLNKNSPSFCADCNLPLNGAVAALQHYESKKHKATLRKRKVAAKKAGKTEAEQTEKKEGDEQPKQCSLEKQHSIKSEEASTDNEAKEKRLEVFSTEPCEPPRVEALPDSQPAPPRSAKIKLAKIAKRVLRKSKKSRLSFDALEQAVRETLGADCPGDLPSKLRAKIQKPPFRLSSTSGKVSLVQE